MPGFAFCPTVKYTVDIELLVLRFIVSLLICHTWPGLAANLMHLAW